MSEGAPEAAARWRALLPHAIAAGLFALAALVVFADLWRAGPAEVVPVRPTQGVFRLLSRADATFEAWLVARNAHTLATRPHRVFDAEHCAPAEKTLTLGIPMLTQGLLAIPAALATREALLVYNLSLVAITLVGAFAMYALITLWTGVPAAGWVAGLLFGFQPLRLGHITHPSVWDISWTVLAILFAERLFARGTWRYALLLSAAIALQIGTSFYPLLAATLLAGPLLVWLTIRYGLRRAGAGRLALVAALSALAAAAVLGPYLGAESSSGEFVRDMFIYLHWRTLVDPSTLHFPGWCVLALAVAAFAMGRRGAATGIGGDPRLALLIGGLLAALVAAGPNTPALPDLHALLARVVPGLDAVRGIERLSTGLQLALVVLAGLGAAALIRAAGSRGPWVAAALVAVAALDVLPLPALGALGLEPRYGWILERARPDDSEIAFFDELERRGNRGPLLELPLDDDADLVAVAPRRILLSAWHRRRTSACFGSYSPPGRQSLQALAVALPSPGAIRALADLGFTTVVMHASLRPTAGRLAARLERASETDPQLVPLHATPERAAYLLRPDERRDQASAAND